MKLIAEHLKGKVLKGDALQIGAEAKAAKKQDPQVINGTVGMFYQEDGSFRGFQTVSQILKNLSDEEIYSYSATDGGPEFHDAVLNWVFDEYREEIESELSCKVMATPGGTGALVSSIFNSLGYGQILLFPDLYWGPYVGMAKNYGFQYRTFPMFAGNSFNIQGFINEAEKIFAEQQKLVFIINDPCHNPSGYTFTEAEVAAIISYLNSKSLPSMLIYDIAYLDMDFKCRKTVRQKFRLFTLAKEHLMISICFSASKTFAVYGQRLGAQIILGKDQANILELYRAGKFFARNTWSNSNRGLISLMTAFNNNQDLKDRFLKELADVRSELKKRANLFLKEAKAIGLETHPYEAGFFISIPVANNQLVLEKLIKEEKTYLLPFSNSIRLALCSLTLSEIKGLAAKIKKIITSIT